ncbi:MAG: hypothetical protein NVS1B10_07030 [Candidatus Saccharimonadales bacterium]
MFERTGGLIMSERILSGIAVAEARAKETIENLNAVRNLDAELDKQTKARQAYLTSPEVAKLNDVAQIEIFGTAERTKGFVDPITGREINTPIAGKVNEILANPRYGTKKSDRQEKAEEYQSSILNLVEAGFELYQAKTIVDKKQDNLLRQQLMVAKLTAQSIRNGESPEQAYQIAQDRISYRIAKEEEKQLSEVLTESELNKLRKYESAKTPKVVLETHKDKTVVIEESDLEPVSKEADETIETKVSKFKIEVATAESAVRGEDKILVDKENQLYAVIDGMGGSGHGDIAASVVHDATINYWDNVRTQSIEINEDNAVEHMKAAFSAAEAALMSVADTDNETKNMGAVATMIKIYENNDGSLSAVVGHVGDTQLRLQRQPDDEVRLLTEDEGVGRFVHNALTADKSNNANLSQFFVESKIEPGARLILNSDGISGDMPEHKLSNQDYADVFAIKHEQDAADELLDRSLKNDDKSVVVIDIGSSNDEIENSFDNPITITEYAGPEVDVALISPIENESELDTELNDIDEDIKLKARKTRLATKLRNLPLLAGIKISNNVSRAYSFYTEKERRKKRTGFTLLGAVALAGGAALAYSELKTGGNASHHLDLLNNHKMPSAKGTTQLGLLESQLPPASKAPNLHPLVEHHTAASHHVQHSAHHAAQSGHAAKSHHTTHFSQESLPNSGNSHSTTSQFVDLNSAPQPALHVEHLQQGHNIWSDVSRIAQMHHHHLSQLQMQHLINSSVNSILEYNGISDPTHLPVGFHWTIPNDVYSHLTAK